MPPSLNISCQVEKKVKQSGFCPPLDSSHENYLWQITSPLSVSFSMCTMEGLTSKPRRSLKLKQWGFKTCHKPHRMGVVGAIHDRSWRNPWGREMLKSQAVPRPDGSHLHWVLQIDILGAGHHCSVTNSGHPAGVQVFFALIQFCVYCQRWLWRIREVYT